MKPKSANRFLFVLRRLLSSQALIISVLASPAMAGTVYWDTNTTTAGSGNVDGAWDATTANWSTSSAGTGTTAAWVPGDSAVFAAGTDFTGTRIVTVSGTQSLAGITLNSQLTNLTITGGTLAFGGTQGIINTSAWGVTSGKTFTLASILTGSNGLAIASNGDLSASGGGNSSVTKLSGVNTFTGDVSITSGLVAYAADSAFGNAANKIILNGGGLLDNSSNVNLARDMQILAGGGTFRAYGGTTTAAWSGAITGSGAINRTDGGTISLTGNLSGYTGTYTNQGGTTRFQTGANALTGTLTITGGLASIENSATNTYTAVNLNGGTLGIKNNSNAIGTLSLPVGGSATIAVQAGSSAITLANNITVSGTNTLSLDASGGALNLNGNVTGTGVTLQTTGASGTTTLTGTINLGTAGTLSVSGAQTLALSGAIVTADTVAMTGTTVANNLNISGGTVTTKYLNIGNASGNSGRVTQSGGTVTVLSGGNGMRIGHWNNSTNPGSTYNLSGGTLDASAILANIGWDGQGDMTVGGGLGTATFKANGIQLDANGNGGGSGSGDMTLTVSSLGTVEVGSGSINAAAAGDRVILNGGTLKAMSSATWGSVINANAATTSAIDANSTTLVLNNNLTGSGTIDLGTTGSISFSTTGSQTISPALAGSSLVKKAGTGTTTFSGTSTHSGLFDIDAGRLNLTGSLGSDVLAKSGTTIGGEGTFTNNVVFSTGSKLAVDSSTASAVTFNNVDISGLPTISFDNLPNAGQNPVKLFTYTGTLTGTASTDLVVATPANYRGTTITDTGGVVTLDLNNKNLVWNGTTGGQWNVGISARWNALEADSFYWGDAVTFDDTGASTAITLAGELQPSSISVSSSTNNYTITGSAGNFISGSTGLSKSGTSTLILNAANTYTGATTVNAGTLQIGNGTNNTATLGNNSATTVASGSTLAFYRNGAYAIGNSISGSGTVAFLGTGVSNQSDYAPSGINSSFSGLFDVRNGSRFTVDSANDTGTAAINIASGAGLYLNGTISNAITITGNGWTEPNGQLGALRVGSAGVVNGGVTLAGNSRLTSWVGETGTINGVITDGASSFSIEKTGIGILTLVPANTFDGGTVISFGSLNIRNAGSLGTGAVTIGNSGTGTNAAGLYLDTNRVTFTSPVTVSSNGTGTATLGTRSTVTGSGAGNGFSNIVLQRSVTFDSNATDRTDYLITSGTGDVTFTGGGRSLMVAASTFTGNITVNPSAVGGHLQIGTATASLTNYIPDSSNLTVTDFPSATQAEFRLSSQGETVNGLNGNGTIDTNSITGTLTVGGAGGGGTFSGALTGTTLNFAKTGAGTQVLSGANTFTGSVAITGGTLSISGANGVINATSGVSIAAGTTLTLDNTSTANNVNRLKDTGTVTMNGGTFNFSNNGGAVDYLETTGALSIASGVNTITSSQATAPNLSTLTFASLARTSGATVNFTGTGLGVNNQNKILITGQAVGLIGPWATINGTQLAGYDATKGVTAYTAYTDVTRTDSGTKVIADASASNVQIVEGTGSVVANITLAAATTNINSLVQNANGGTSTVALPSQTLRLGTAGGILAWPAMGNLVVGATVGEGTLTAGGSATNVAGDISLVNNSSTGALITVNSVIANNGTGVVTLNKTGVGTVVLTGANTYTGTTTVNAGTLESQAKGGGVVQNYVVNPNGTLKFGFNVGQTYEAQVTVNGSGTAATTGLYLNGGRTITYQQGGGNGLTLSTAPTTIRTYGTGNAVLSGYDNRYPHLLVNTAASGSEFVSTINFTGGSFGYLMNVASGANTATGDVVINGQLTGNSTNFIKIGTGSVLLNGASTSTSSLEIREGKAILGTGANRLNAGSSVVLGSGTTSGKLTLNGNAQTLAGLSSSGTGTGNAVIGASTTTSSLTISNTAAVTFPSASTTAILGGTGANENNLTLTKAGSGTLNLGGTNTYTGGTTISGGILSLASAGAVGTTGSITLNGGTLQFTAANTTDYTASGRLKLADGVVSSLDTNAQNVTLANALAIGSLGTGGLGKSGAGTLTITANQAYAGGSSVNGGTLVLSYATANGSKLSDSGTLTLGTGTLSLDGGSHEELVGSTIVTGTAVINRTSGTAVINLGTITRTGSNTLDIAADNIAKTSLSNDISGKLPVWITVGGAPAANDGSGNIVAFNGFYNVFRLGGQIPNNALNNVKIIDGGFSGDVTPATPGTTDAASLVQSATGGPAVVLLGSSDILRLGALGSISVPSTSGTLTLQDGSLTAGGADDTAGNITFDAGNDIIVNSAINKNGSANVSITKQGSAALTLAANNFFVGGTTINAGRVNLNNEFALGGAPLTINGGTLDNTSGSPITIGESITQTWNSDVHFIGTNDLNFGGGAITLTGSRTVTVDNGTLGLGSSGAINGAFALTKAGSGTLVVGGGNWTGTTTLTGGTLEVPAKTNDVAYVMGSGTTLKIGYTTGGGGANTNLKLTGNGTAATTGLYLKGGANYNANGGIELLGAPTTIRQYGTGLAGIGMWDINGNAITAGAAASGSVIDANIEFTSRGYGNSVNVAAGSANATGDLVINGPLNITLAQSGNTLGFYKRGSGSVALNAPANVGNVSLRLEGGSVITGAVDAIGVNSSVVLSGGTKLLMKGSSQAVGSLSGSGAIVNGSSTATVLTVKQATSAQAFNGDQTFSGLLGGTGTDENNFSLVKTGASKLTLTAANTYTGNTTVNAGTLAMSSAYLANSSDVLITTGATLELNTGTTDTIDELIVDGTPQAPGVYGSLTSTAQFKRSYITGNGTLTVTTGPAGYDSWASANGVTGGPSGDSDNDGITNLVEYALNLNPSASDGAAGTFDGTTLSFTKRALAVSNGDVNYAIEVSTDLGATDPWTTVSGAGFTDNSTTISYVLPTGPVKNFARLKVTKP